MGGNKLDTNEDLYSKLGTQIFENMENGFNSTIFAYGQTGSGKSFSIEGSSDDSGLLQRYCEKLFEYKDKIEKNHEGNDIDIDVSYLEIYNENLRDLLDSGKKALKIFALDKEIVVKNLSKIPVDSFKEIKELLDEGKKMRVVGATSMNKQSSRSHAIFTLHIKIKSYDETSKSFILKKSSVNLVDLAGSERADKTGAKGKKLKEGSNINKSLTFLGVVIEKLSKTKSSKDHIPYRNSQLTYILSHSLGGNSKTIMIAAISPAASNHSETKSTLMFAQRVATVSNDNSADVKLEVDAKSKLEDEIKQLQDQLKALLAGEQTEETKDKIMQIKTQLIDLSEGDDKEAKRAKKKLLEEERKKALEDAGLGSVEESKNNTPDTPFLMNVADDPSLAGMLKLYLSDGPTTIGSNPPPGGLKIKGLGIHDQHCSIKNDSNDYIYLTASAKNRVLLNGNILDGSKELKHKDRIVLGHGSAWQINIPKHPELQENGDDLQYDDVMNDRLQSDTPEARNIRKYLSDMEERIGAERTKKFVNEFAVILDLIDEANAFSRFRFEKLPDPNNNIYFTLEIMVDIMDYENDEPEFAVRMRDKPTDKVKTLWDFEDFKERVEAMAEWYEDMSDDGILNREHFFDPWSDTKIVDKDEAKEQETENFKDQLAKVEALIIHKKEQITTTETQLKDHTKNILGKSFTSDQEDLEIFKEIYYQQKEPETENERELEEKFNSDKLNSRYYLIWINTNEDIYTYKIELNKLKALRSKLLDKMQILEDDEPTQNEDDMIEDLQDRIDFLRSHNHKFGKDLDKVIAKIMAKKKSLGNPQSSCCSIF